MKTAVLLTYTGSPESCKITDIVKYLNKFLNNKRLIRLPSLPRTLLVNGAILPRSVFKSAKRYGKLENLYNGKFPISLYCQSLRMELEKCLPAEIFVGMCFGNPLIENSLQTIIEKGFSKLIIFPMFPHYTSSASGVPLEQAMDALKQFPMIPEIVTVNSFYKNQGFIRSFAERIKEYDYGNYDEIVFSYHSLPVEHVKKWDCTYPEMCRETTQLICKETGIDSVCETCFQSQMSNKWLGPSTKSALMRMIKDRKTKALVVAPSFVMDCLETDVEIGIELRDFFLQNGGEKLQLVRSLNDSPVWIGALRDMLEKLI
ncbi:MAG: ferrochelatase [Prevotellaceae bacterium]|jgi:ferrochelatase|nr:ferrochelatase [Prevotellaceae bacterium]